MARLLRYNVFIAQYPAGSVVSVSCPQSPKAAIAVFRNDPEEGWDKIEFDLWGKVQQQVKDAASFQRINCFFKALRWILCPVLTFALGWRILGYSGTIGYVVLVIALIWLGRNLYSCYAELVILRVQQRLIVFRDYELFDPALRYALQLPR